MRVNLLCSRDLDTPYKVDINEQSVYLKTFVKFAKDGTIINARNHSNNLRIKNGSEPEFSIITVFSANNGVIEIPEVTQIRNTDVRRCSC